MCPISKTLLFIIHEYQETFNSSCPGTNLLSSSSYLGSIQNEQKVVFLLLV